MPGENERSSTARQSLRTALGEKWQDARQLSQLLRLSEREIYEHLKHLERSARGGNERLLVRPSECLGCGFVFAERGRLTPPSRCPKCKSERISTPAFLLAGC